MVVPSPPPRQSLPTQADDGLTREVMLRIDRWLQERALTLPPETRAGFVDMGVDALAGNPDRPRAEVLDELVAELDASLARIHAEPRADDARPRRRSLLRRLLRRG